MEKNYSIIKALMLIIVLNISATLVHGQMAKCKGKYLGNIIANSVRSDFNTYWNGVTAENGCKWDAVEPNRDQYSWTAADRAYKHAKDNGFIFRWHTFVWGSQEPKWIGALNAQDTRDEVEELMKLVAQRYPAIDYIDVVNEALHAPASYREDLGGANNGVDAADRGTGYDWIVWSFRKARQYFPNAKLVLNDYGLENDANAINNMLKIVKVLKDRNLIDGFGTQAHTFNVDGLSATTLKSRLDLMATGGVPIYVTELDLTGSPASEANQLTSYRNLFPVYWEHPNVAGITLWGYVEGATWKAGTGLLNSNGTERSAMTWLKSYMAGRPNVAGCGTPPPNTPPTVSFTTPANNTSFTAPASVTIAANAADADGTVSNVQFYSGTTLLGSDATAPYSFSWTNVAAGTYTLTAKATDNNGAATTSSAVTVVVNPPAVNQAPSVAITNPLNNASYTAPATISISANATDADGAVSSVQFYSGGTLLGTDASAPYSFSWTNVAAGAYSITVRATDNSGAVTTSSAVVIVVNPGVPTNQPPTVSVTSPLNNATFITPATIAIAATAADADGTISGVQFYSGTTLLGVDSVAPYSTSWSNVPAGTYSITARAIDNNGATTTSSVITIKVNAPNTAPVVTITSPANNASYIAPATVVIGASASDVDGTINSVQFYNGTTLLGSDATSPYSFSWANVAAGTYSITARATDNSGAVTTSSAVVITVTAAPAGDIIGPDCGAVNSTISFEVNPAKRTNATAYSWWVNGYSQKVTPVAGQPYKVDINTGAYFTGGQVCVQVQYSSAPYSAMLCKPLTKCTSAGKLSALPEIETTTIVPNPSSDAFVLTVNEEVEMYKILDDKGTIIYNGRALANGESVRLGEQLPSGLYLVMIQYVGGRVETKKVQKSL